MASNDDKPGRPRRGRQKPSSCMAEPLRSQFGETSEAMFLTQGFVYANAEQAEARFKNEDPGLQYSRFGNPTVAMFEERIRLLEGAEEARATATGMAAVNAALLSYLKAGDHIVVGARPVRRLPLHRRDAGPRYGIASTLIDGRDIEDWKKAMRPNTKLFFFETPSNPTLELVDIAAVSKIAHEIGAIVVVDNVFATPLLQRPLQHGADVVVYSATKHIDGQGRCLGGAVLGSKDYVTNHLQEFLRQTGPTMSPFNAWVMLKGLETMPVRVRAQVATAARIADHLAGQPGRHPRHLLRTHRPSAGGYREAPDDRRRTDDRVRGRRRQGGAFALQNALQLIKISNNLGDAKSLITHPATTTHHRIGPEARAELGISDGMLRLSVGLEAFEDLAADLDAGLAATPPLIRCSPH